MPATTSRGGFRYPVGADNSKAVRTDITNLADDVAGKVALYVESTAAARPAPGVPGRIHRATDTGAVTWDAGASWDDVGVSRAGGSVITTSGPSVRGLVVKTAAGQVANATEWQDNAGAIKVRVLPQGTIIAGALKTGLDPSTDTLPGMQNGFASRSTTDVLLAVRGSSGQTAPLTEWQDSAGTPVLAVDAAGRWKASVGNLSPSASAGAAGAPPAQVVGYLSFLDNAGLVRKLPYYAA